ncbi:hypothetical protein ACU4GD_41595 [Cupriavidus basilensis]
MGAGDSQQPADRHLARSAGTGGTNLRQHPRRGGGCQTCKNPLGSIMPDASKAQLVAWCDQRAIAPIEDDLLLRAGGQRRATGRARSAWDRGGGIHCASLHKILAPGMRLGWIAAGKWQARVEMLGYSQSRPNELLAQIRGRH